MSEGHFEFENRFRTQPNVDILSRVLRPSRYVKPHMGVDGMKNFLIVVTTMIALACDIAGPSYPDVAGSYSGPVTWTKFMDEVEMEMTMTVVQSDDGITVTGMTLDGSLLLPMLTGTIDETGLVTITESTPVPSSHECGVIRADVTTLSFVEGTARYWQFLLDDCGNFSAGGTIPRT